MLATLNFGYMTVDGSRALMQGDYFRPQSGEHAGQLGPWTEVVSAVGIEPESTPMKILFLVWGTIGLILTVSYAMEVRGAGRALLLMNILSLWYLIPGTINSIVQIILLLYIRNKK